MSFPFLVMKDNYASCSIFVRLLNLDSSFGGLMKEFLTDFGK